MRIVTNPGSNLHPSLAEHYDIDLLPQMIVVGDTRYDTREAISLQQVDAWVRTAKQYPTVLGMSAAQFVTHWLEIAKEDREILFVASSRKIISSYDAARGAARTLNASASHRDLDIRVVDSGMTDVGAALVTVLVAEGRRQGLGPDEICDLSRRFSQSGRMVIAIANLEGLIQGGRADFLRGWIANLLRIRPILGFEDGELRAVGRMAADADAPALLAERLAEDVRGRRVWVGVSHSDDPSKADRLVSCLRERFQVEYVYVRPTAPSIYLHTGRGAIAAAVFPVDDLPIETFRPLALQSDA